MPNITPESSKGPSRPEGQDLSGPEFLYYEEEWNRLVNQIFKLGYRYTFNNYDSKTGKPTLYNLCIDQGDRIIELQALIERPTTQGEEFDKFSISFLYRKPIPIAEKRKKIHYAMISEHDEAISIVMFDKSRQTNPKRASEITDILKDIANDPYLDQQLLSPDKAKESVAELDKLN